MVLWHSTLPKSRGTSIYGIGKKEKRKNEKCGTDKQPAAPHRRGTRQIKQTKKEKGKGVQNPTRFGHLLGDFDEDGCRCRTGDLNLILYINNTNYFLCIYSNCSDLIHISYIYIYIRYYM